MAIIGQGNVALDIARIFLTHPHSLQVQVQVQVQTRTPTRTPGEPLGITNELN